MKSILQACEPRQDIITGSFNPEIFTPSISSVIRYYRDDGKVLESLYTNARDFFLEATYPTDGLKMVVSDVFRRLAGNNMAPAIHRLETAFGGGKTHALISCAHIGFKGSELKDVTASILPPDLLPKPGEIHVVGIAGDEIPVHKTKGPILVPYTLWGEIAYQIGGEALYRSVEEDASSFAAPAKNYFDAVFEGRKILLMIDELAQYTARLSAAQSGGGEQLAAFLMALLGFARDNPGISILLTLASAADAFANQTEQLTKVLSQVLGKAIDSEEALRIGREALKSVPSVVARDASPVVPVQAAEISRVLAKRLFTKIDRSIAEETARTYEDLYRKNSSLLPDSATRAEFRDTIVNLYPFHPTMIDFLTKKLATSENFHSTRGVLRVLTLAVRSLWRKKVDIPMIHTCHLNLRDAQIVNELIGRTGTGNLLPILNADIGGVDTSLIEGGSSNAELADRKNPHPEKWPMYEYTWKTIFLNSLVGSGQGLDSKIFGLMEQDALFSISFPGLTPTQVLEALKEITKSAFYLKHAQGRYFADLEPTVNIVLNRIQRTLSLTEKDDLVQATARTIVSADKKGFQVLHDVALPEHIPDNKGRPILALVSPLAAEVNIDQCIMMAGPNQARIEQNLVMILTPDTVEIQGKRPVQATLLGGVTSPSTKSLNRLREIAGEVLAIRRLKKNSASFGIKPKKLEEEEFKQRTEERELALQAAVTESYRTLWYPSAKGQIVAKEIRTAGGEGGVSVFEQIRKVLLEDGELVTEANDNQAGLVNLRKIFFTESDYIDLSTIRKKFAQRRSWPILEQPSVLDRLIRSGVNRGIWCLFKMTDENQSEPDEFFSQEKGELPYTIELNREGYSLITPEGARQRGWTKEGGPDPARVRDWIKNIVFQMKEVNIQTVLEKIESQYGTVPKPIFKEAVSKLLQNEQVMLYKEKEEGKPPDLIYGSKAVFYQPEFSDTLITPAEAAKKGWIKSRAQGINLSGKEGAAVILPILRRMGSLFSRGGKTKIDHLEMVDLELLKGGNLRIVLSDLPPESTQSLAELFEVLDGVVKEGESTEAYLEIKEPQEDCPFVKELNALMGKKGKDQE